MKILPMISSQIVVGGGVGCGGLFVFRELRFGVVIIAFFLYKT